MSKSKGNVISLLDVNNQYSAEVFRYYMTTATTIDGTFNWKSEDAESVKKILTKLYETLDHMVASRKEGVLNDKSKAFVSKFERTVKDGANHLDKMQFRDYGMKVAYGLLSDLKKVEKVLDDEEKKVLYNYVVEKWIKMLAPVAPHFAEELWSKIGDGFVSLESWPECDESRIDQKAEFSEEVVSNLVGDINQVKKLAKIEKLIAVKLIVSANWKYEFISKFKAQLEETRNIGKIIKRVMDKEHGKEISKLVPVLVQHPQKVPKIVLRQDEEIKMLDNAKQFLEKEFGCTVSIEKAEDSSENKADGALPGKVAIVIA